MSAATTGEGTTSVPSPEDLIEPTAEQIKRYLVIDIGCIECGEPSGVVGMAETVEEAAALRAAAIERQRADWHGQHDFDVWDLHNPPKSEHAPLIPGDPITAGDET